MTLDLSPGERGRVNQAGRGSGGRLDRRNSPDEGCRGRRGTERRSMESRGQGHRGRIDEDEKVSPYPDDPNVIYFSSCIINRLWDHVV